MKENMLDVLLYMFEFCDEEELRLEEGEEALHGKLVRAGFGNQEIFKAFSWLNELSEQGDEPSRLPDTGSFRIFAQDEILRLPVECRSMLMLLEQFGVIGHDSREQIIERALALEVEDMDLDQFKWVLMMVLLNQDKEVPAFILNDENLMGEGSTHPH